MAASSSPVSLSQAYVPVFSGAEYGRWSLRMKTVFRSQEVWDLVEKGWVESKDEAVEKENKKRDAKALSLIQQAVDGANLDRISEAKTAHEAWEILRKQCQGTTKVRSVRIQALHQDFETLQMEDSESIQAYVSRVVAAVSQIRALGHKLGEPEVVSKVLRSLAPKFDFVVVAIKESKEISKLSLDDLTGTLLAHEVKVNRATARVSEKAMVIKGDSSSTCSSKGGSPGNSWSDARGRGRGGARWRGRGQGGRGRNTEHRS
ncbi:uncharacterized protein LOC120271680 [Dioscorea cayenensis subsp. rotundata]|uniref:Uncharacterized protein LOC120271680 n=1 Tax=Dioscorea cayennensis subsp. rotundata TaxID=55577 RepID=A0AB40C5Z4_DIOCR|nr:uncharacterized protein LOC120271680 [Dioscorea cayenensis subsp. rotundata]